jgi:hypothetical protein
MNYRLEVVYNILRLWLVNKTYPPIQDKNIIIKRTEEIKRPYGQK